MYMYYACNIRVVLMSKLMNQVRVATKMMDNLKVERVPLLPQVHSGKCVHLQYPHGT